MTMHIEGPWLSTSGKKKGKKKFASAEHKKRSEQLASEWKELQKRWGINTDSATVKRQSRHKKDDTLSYKLSAPIGRETKHIPSLGDTTGFAAVQKSKIYTGTKVKGIATMHKSNAVPVFSDDEAKDISSMRR